MNKQQQRCVVRESRQDRKVIERSRRQRIRQLKRDPAFGGPTPLQVALTVVGFTLLNLLWIAAMVGLVLLLVKLVIL